MTDSYRDFREIELDGYIHDEWKVLPKLTVNIGIRYEFVTNPTTNVHPLKPSSTRRLERSSMCPTFSRPIPRCRTSIPGLESPMILSAITRRRSARAPESSTIRFTRAAMRPAITSIRLTRSPSFRCPRSPIRSRARCRHRRSSWGGLSHHAHAAHVSVEFQYSARAFRVHHFDRRLRRLAGPASVCRPRHQSRAAHRWSMACRSSAFPSRLADAGHRQQPAPQSGRRRVEQRGSRGRLELPLLAGGPEPALLARRAIAAFLHLVEVHGRRLRHLRTGGRHPLVQSAERLLRPRTLPV